MMAQPPGRPPVLQEEREKPVLQNLDSALPKNSAALAILSPYFPVAVTPRRIRQASLGLEEELAVEEAVESICGTGATSLYLVLNSYGGTASASFKIARLLRDCFDDVQVYVPHFAVSGGTLLALSGNRIVLGPMSHLGPIDMQVFHKGTWYSVNSMIRAFDALTELFKEVHVEDAPYPWRAMADKLNPVEFQWWTDVSAEMDHYASRLLRHPKSPFKDRSDEIIHQLTVHLPTHTTVILRDQAKEILQDAVVFSEKEGKMWGIARQWLRNYSTAEFPFHFVRYHIRQRTSNAKVSSGGK